MNGAITIRRSTPSDGAAITRLAALDDRPAPRGDALLAFVDGELRAAVPLERGSAVADPFHLGWLQVDGAHRMPIAQQLGDEMAADEAAAAGDDDQFLPWHPSTDLPIRLANVESFPASPSRG